MSSQRNEKSFLGLNFSPLENVEIVDQILHTKTSQGKSVHFINAFSISCTRKFSGLLNIYKSGLVLCDGRPLHRILNLRGIAVSHCRGMDFLRLSIVRSTMSNKHFFLGATLDVLKEIELRAGASNSNFVIVGKHSPPFEDNLESHVESWSAEISKSNATIVWVGLGTPKQDFIAHAIAQRLNVTTIAIGAAFDFYAGKKREAPRVIQTLSLEWLFRLLNEPRRLLYRYFIGNFVFIKFILSPSSWN
jgi:N-acetylglucosaminyldiphosphoundecaprenol N-acetyl-beta-D-mannosaminyltransferase